MKPLHIGLLIAAGALGGAVIMKVAERPHVALTMTPISATSPAPTPAQSAQVTVPPVPAAPAEAAPPAIGAQPAATPPAATQPAATQQPIEPAPPERQVKPSPMPKPLPPRHPKIVAEPPARSETAAHLPRPSAPTPATPPPALTRPEPVAPAPTPASPTASAPASQPAASQPEPLKIPPAPPEPEHVTPPPAPVAPPEPNKVTLTAGTLIPVRLVDGLSSERNVAGDLFTGTLDSPLTADGFVIAERGARVEGRVVSTDKGGRVQGVAAIAVEITRVHLSDGQTIAVSTSPFTRQAEASHRDDAAKVGAGAALGAVIGAIAGGGKGAAIGAGAGGAAGAGTVAATRGRAATLPSETRVSFRLREPVTVTERIR